MHPLEEEWKALKKELRPLESFFKMPLQDRSNPASQDTFLEFVEKQVILDLVSEPFISNNFIAYKSFPFNPEGFLGEETAMLNVFTFWDHYVGKYQKKIKKLAVLEQEYDKFIEEEGRALD